MGVASMSLTCSMPSAVTALTWDGNARGTGSRAGTRLSRISVVLPEPDTPVTTVSLPWGFSPGVHRVNGIGGKADAPPAKGLFPRPGRQRGGRRAQKGSDHRLGVLLNFGHSALSDDVTTARTGFGAHLDDPIGLGQHLGVVIHQYHRVTVLDQIVHDAGQAHDVGRCRPMDGSSST